MTRYFRLYMSFIRFSLSKSMQFRFDFYFRIFMDIIFYVVNVMGLKLIFLHTDSMGGWTLQESYVFLSLFLVVDGFYMTVFSQNMWNISLSINRGELDYYLLRPASILFFVTLRDFSFSSFINLLMAFGILGWSLANLPNPLGFSEQIYICFAILNGIFLYAAANLAFVIPVFWTHSGRGLVNLYFTSTRFMERPEQIYSKGLRWFLRTILPLSIITSVPATLVLRGLRGDLLILWAGVSIAFYFAVYTFWNIGLKRYSSASS